MASEAIEVFFSYAREDKALRNKLATHLSLMQHQGIIKAWYDGNIIGGTAWEKELLDHLDSARMILLLVSSDFLASTYSYETELALAMERHKKGEAIVIPIILRPCDWHGAPFGKLQALPEDAKAITKWEDQDDAFLSVAKGIRAAVQKLAAQPN
jgi:TIR domain